MDGVERVFREAHGQAVATLIRRFGDISLAEDVVADAFVTAMQRWPRDGVPDNPAGWIVTTARHRAVDLLRRSRRGEQLVEQIATDRLQEGAAESADSELGRDDQLRLVFTCCHPALRLEHQVALTLRLIAGLSTAEVASAFLVDESTMAKRLVRARHKIKAAHIPYRVPDDTELPARLRPVLSVLYLIYNAGADDVRRRGDLRREAIRLARVLVALMSEEPEAAGLLALMLLNEARMPARGDGEGIVRLQDQNRSRWDPTLIAEGQELVLACIRRHQLGPFQLQAAIQAIHCAAARHEDTDWPTIVRFYDRLIALMPTPVIALNRAVAMAETSGPRVALDLLNQIAGDLPKYHLLHAARGSMLRQLGRRAEAADAYARAAELAPSEAETQHLREQSRHSLRIDTSQVVQ